MKMRLSTYALLAAAVLSTMLVWILRPNRPMSVGFEVLLLKLGEPHQPTDYWGNTLIVKLDSSNRLSLNERGNLSRRELQQLLRENLCRRAEKLVLFEADPALPYKEALEGIDAIKTACQTEIALITPAIKDVDFSRIYVSPHPTQPSIRSAP